MQVKNEMSLEEFLCVMQEKIVLELGESYSVDSMSVLKNNGVRLKSLLIRNNGEKIVPNIYMNSFYTDYRKGKNLNEILHDILRTYNSTGLNIVKEQENYYSFEKLQSGVVYRLVNFEKNRELLQLVPHIRVLDFAVTFHNIVNKDEQGISSIRLTKEHQKLWGLSNEELLQYAKRNTPRLFPPSVRSMEEVMKEIMIREVLEISVNEVDSDSNQGELLLQAEQSAEEFIHMLHQDKNNHVNMYILSNHLGINGASCMLYPEVLNSFAKLVKSDFYILPSSIHEVILVPYEEKLDPKQLKSMVMEINQTQVPVDEVLSDEVYQYSQIANRLFI